MKGTETGRAGERGVSLVVVTVAMVAIMGMAGLAIDVGQMYVAKQRAQVAADAAVQAAAMDLYNGTSADYQRTATAYAALNKFNLPGDTLVLSGPFSCGNTGGAPADVQTLCSHMKRTDNAEQIPVVIEVTATRQVTTTFLRVLSINGSSVGASAFAAITFGPAAIPIVVTHPRLQDALRADGGTLVRIKGGTTRAIQVNSTGTIDSNGHVVEARAVHISNNAAVNLSQAGPAPHTGADFRTWGPPWKLDAISDIDTTTVSDACASWLCLGKTGHYEQPASVIADPFAGLAQPTADGLTPGNVIETDNRSNNSPVALNGADCPAATCPKKSKCYVYGPGIHSNGITVSGAIAYFKPGLYYIPNTATIGFVGASGSDMQMLSSIPGCTVTADSKTGNGMVVFNAGSGAFAVGANGSAVLVGPAFENPAYEGILFWQDRDRDPGVVVEHKFGGGGQLQLTGSIYTSMLMPNSRSPYNKDFHQVTLKGNAGSLTTVLGEIITNVLYLTGGGNINMELSDTQVKNVRAVAFVQ